MNFSLVVETKKLNVKVFLCSLPYTEASIREIMRFETMLPSGVPHKALVDTEFMGYNIPKGTVIVPGLDAAMHDPTAWDSPKEFRPERFLDSSGKLCLSQDISLPFGAGKCHSCN